MNGYETTKRAIEFTGPDHLPVCASCYEPDFSGDVVFIFGKTSNGHKWGDSGLDEWNCLWAQSDVANVGQVVQHPLADWSSLDGMAFPDAGDSSRYAHLGDVVARGEAGGKYLVFCNGSAVFERMHYLRGFASLLEDLYLEKGNVQRLAERVVKFQLDTLDKLNEMYPGRIHALRCTDDWGTQESTIISPALWRDIFKPLYKQIIDRAHSYGMHMWLHSCGAITPIIEDLIEIGLDVINIEQPSLLGIEAAGKLYAGRICFESHADIQTTLQKGDEGLIRAEVALLLKHWNTPDGGFILGDLATDANGITLQTKELMTAIFKEISAEPAT